MHADPHVERILSGSLRHVLVGANTGRLERLAGELLILVRDEMAAEGEFVDGSALATKIEDADLQTRPSGVSGPVKRTRAEVPTDLRVGHTTVVPRLGVRLVLTVTVAAGGTATHFSIYKDRPKTKPQRRASVSVIQPHSAASIALPPFPSSQKSAKRAGGEHRMHRQQDNELTFGGDGE